MALPATASADTARSSDHVRPLLASAAGCITVVTSRRRLDGLLQGDHLGLVPGSGSEAGA